MLTGLSRCKRLEFRFLQSGHSHEDCDQWFAQIANLVESKRSLKTPSEFQSLLQSWLDEGQTRPDEQRFRRVSMVSASRDWSLRSLIQSLFSFSLDSFPWVGQQN